MNWFMQALKKYAAFEGRARRKEFWFFVLFFLILSVVAAVVDSLYGLPILSIMMSVPFINRHDAEKTHQPPSKISS